MPIRTFAELLEVAKHKGPKTVAVAAAHQSEVLLASLDAELAGLAEVVLVGDSDRIRQIATDEDATQATKHDCGDRRGRESGA